jgi:ABC-type glycerol-3-phosphate transport system substrate-binding protein
MKRAALALAAVIGATVALAQTPPPTPAEPPTSTAPQEQTAPPADSSTRMSDADRQALMSKCVSQVQAANPNVPEKDIKDYCGREIKNIASPQ